MSSGDEGDGSLDWRSGNPTHAQDMYSILTGTAQDVSMLIDYLPTYLFPNEEQKIVDWGIMGISLGGHAVYGCLIDGRCSIGTTDLDDRLAWGCVVIGCPSYIDLMEYRLEKCGLPVSAEYLPEPFRRLVDRNSPGSYFRRTGDVPDALKTKDILILSGQDDNLVPWSASEPFVTKLQEGSPSVQVKLYPGVKHEFAPEMRTDFRNWFLKHI
jgi:acetyl esterase/lipase